MELPLVLLDTDLPIFNPSNIYINWDLRSERAQFPINLFEDNYMPYFYKATSHKRSATIESEIDILLRLERARLTTKIRVPKLCGYVKVDKQNKVIGLLLTYVEHQDTLHGMIRQKPNIALREK